MKQYLSLLAGLLWTVVGHAQTAATSDESLCIADSMSIFYRAGHRYVDPAYRNNGAELEHFLQSVRQARSDDSLVRVSIRSGASPDGDRHANERLSRHRADELAAYLQRQTSLPPATIEKYAEGVDWTGLRRLVKDTDMPHRDEVLHILDKASQHASEDDGTDEDRLKKALMTLHGGEPYRYMRRHLFPDLRSSASVLLHVRCPKSPLQPADTLSPTADIPQPRQDSLCRAYTLSPASRTDNTPATTIPAPADPWQHSLRVKLNAVGWAMLVMNAAVEWEFSPKFSLHIPVFYSGANYFTARTKFRLLGTRPEARFYPLTRRRFFAGVHFGVTSFNLALGSQPWRIQDHDGHTPALGGGLSVGYRMPFCRNRRFQLEFSVGAGAYRAHYDKFYNRPGGVYHSTVRDTYIGIDHVDVSFSYRFDLKRRARQ